MGWDEGVGYTIGAGFADVAGWLALAGIIGAGCIASRRFIHLLLSKASKRTSLTGAVGASLAGLFSGQEVLGVGA